MKKKNRFVTALIAMVTVLVCASCIFAGCSKGNSVKEKLKDILVADSFTVVMDDEEVMRCEDNKLYTKEISSNGTFEEKYFAPDKDGKRWYYSKSYSQDSWVKEAMSNIDYAEYLDEYKCYFGVERYMSVDTLHLMLSDFDGLFKKDGSKYISRTKINSNDYTVWEDKKGLYFDITYKGEIKHLKFVNINSTKVSMPEGAENAKVESDR